MTAEQTCVVCEDPREEWPRDRVILGELTRGDVNMERRDADVGPICSRSCMLELGFDVLPKREISSLSISPRFTPHPPYTR